MRMAATTIIRKRSVRTLNFSAYRRNKLTQNAGGSGYEQSGGKDIRMPVHEFVLHTSYQVGYGKV